MTGASTHRAQSTWQVHRWEHPDGRYFELASNVLSAEEIERRGLPPAAKDYKFHSSTPMVPEADLEQAWRNGWGSALNCLRSFRGLVDVARAMLDESYPPDVFVGGGPATDSGVAFVVKLREALAFVEASDV